MLYREIIAVCSEIHTKHINTLCGQNVEFVNAKPGGTYSDRWGWNGKSHVKLKFDGKLALWLGWNGLLLLQSLGDVSVM
jgi:hypothetical protein